MLADRCVLPWDQGQYIWAVIFLSTSSEGQAAPYDSPPGLCLSLLRTLRSADKSQRIKPLFAPCLIRGETVIDQVFVYGLLIGTRESMILHREGSL